MRDQRLHAVSATTSSMCTASITRTSTVPKPRMQPHVPPRPRVVPRCSRTRRALRRPCISSCSRGIAAAAPGARNAEKEYVPAGGQPSGLATPEWRAGRQRHQLAQVRLQRIDDAHRTVGSSTATWTCIRRSTRGRRRTASRGRQRPICSRPVTRWRWNRLNGVHPPADAEPQTVGSGPDRKPVRAHILRSSRSASATFAQTGAVELDQRDSNSSSDISAPPSPTPGWARSTGPDPTTARPAA